MEGVSDLKVIVIGLGSMGKRRVRNLQALGVKNVLGIDSREDRREEAGAKYNIETSSDFLDSIKSFSPNAVVISLPPDLHMKFATIAYEHNLPCFIEASVIEEDRILDLYEKTKDRGPVMFPSCTMRYFSGPRKIKELVNEGTIGKVLNVNYQTGQYLPDWHPWEDIQEYYVSKRETGAAREIVPFELTWINDIWGSHPEVLACVKDKLTDMNADIDDIYHLILRYPENVLINMTVEVISRPCATRDMRILGSEGEIVFSQDYNTVKYCTTENSEWKVIDLQGGTVESGYINPEEPYINEVRDYLIAVMSGNGKHLLNTLQDDYYVLSVLRQAEKICK